MFISKKHYNDLYERANTVYVQPTRFHSESLYEQLKMVSMQQDILNLKNKNLMLETKLEQINSEQKRKEIEYSNACLNKAMLLLEEGKVVESELAMRLYEQYK